jgi:hypothetical protein
MANITLAVLETALRERKLDRTLTTALPPLERSDPAASIPFDIAVMDAVLRGGLPRGQVSELAGPHSSGRTTLLLQLLAAATCGKEGRGGEGSATRGREIAALVDTCDRLDVASASAAGIDLERLLWIRGESSGLALSERSESMGRIVDRALKALNLVLQAGGFGCVVLDLADVPPVALRRIPVTTWLRVQRIIEGRDTACVLIAAQPLARSAGGLTLSLAGHVRWTGDADRSRHLTGADIDIRIVSPRRRMDGQVSIPAFATTIADDRPQRRMPLGLCGS